MTPLLASIILICTPQADKDIKRTCIVWVRRCVYEQQLRGTSEDQAEENCMEAMPEELYPQK